MLKRRIPFADMRKMYDPFLPFSETKRKRLFMLLPLDISLDVMREWRAHCSKSARQLCKKLQSKNFVRALQFFLPPFIIKLQSKIGSCKEVFRTRAATITRLARQSVSDEDLKHFCYMHPVIITKRRNPHELTHKRTCHHPRRRRQGLL